MIQHTSVTHDSTYLGAAPAVLTNLVKAYTFLSCMAECNAMKAFADLHHMATTKIRHGRSDHTPTTENSGEVKQTDEYQATQEAKGGI